MESHESCEDRDACYLDFVERRKEWVLTRAQKIKAEMIRDGWSDSGPTEAEATYQAIKKGDSQTSDKSVWNAAWLASLTCELDKVESKKKRGKVIMTELLEETSNQAPQMTIAPGPGVNPGEVGHWGSLAQVARLIEAAREECANVLKVELSKISDEMGLPPGIGSAPGELKRMLDDGRAAVKEVARLIDVIECASNALRDSILVSGNDSETK